jgi:hypothetical protein
LALQVLSKSMDATSANPDRYEVAIIHKDEKGNVV